ncbi:membrane protein [Candidatus Magnetoovum chiemensis]|nr:membrane protein [Candidatus Magnetoovum chiemensis]
MSSRASLLFIGGILNCSRSLMVLLRRRCSRVWRILMEPQNRKWCLVCGLASCLNALSQLHTLSALAMYSSLFLVYFFRLMIISANSSNTINVMLSRVSRVLIRGLRWLFVHSSKVIFFVLSRSSISSSENRILLKLEWMKSQILPVSFVILDSQFFLWYSSIILMKSLRQKFSIVSTSSRSRYRMLKAAELFIGLVCWCWSSLTTLVLPNRRGASMITDLSAASFLSSQTRESRLLRKSLPITALPVIFLIIMFLLAD